MLTHRAATILGDIPEDWEKDQLFGLLKMQHGGDWGNDTGQIAARVLRSTNFTSRGHLNYQDIALRYFPESKRDKLRLNKHDLLLERSGGGPTQPVGRLGFIAKDLPDYWFSNFVQLLRPDANKIDPEFLGWLLLELNRSGVVERLQHQTTQMRNLDFRDYLKVYLPKPPREEQEIIVRILCAANNAIDAANAKLKAARDLKSALMQRIFTRGIPGRHTKFKKTKIGEIPERWELPQLRRLFSSATNGLYVPDTDYGSGTPIVRIDTFEDGEFYNREFQRIRITDREIDLYEVRNGDVLINRVNSIPFLGKVVFVNGLSERTVFESNMMRLRFDSSELAQFVAMALSTPANKRRIWSMGRPAIGQLSINQREMGQFLVAVPSNDDERKEIVFLVQCANRAIDAIERESFSSSTLMRSLQSYSLTGRARMRM